MSETKEVSGTVEAVGEEVVKSDMIAVQFHAMAVNSFAQDPMVIHLATLDIAMVQHLFGDVRRLTNADGHLPLVVARRQRVEAALGLVVTLYRSSFPKDGDTSVIEQAKIVLGSHGLLDMTSQVVGDVMEYRSARADKDCNTLVSENDVYTVLTASQEKAIDDADTKLTVVDFVLIVRIAASVIRGVRGVEGAGQEGDGGQ